MSRLDVALAVAVVATIGLGVAVMVKRAHDQAENARADERAVERARELQAEIEEGERQVRATIHSLYPRCRDGGTYPDGGADDGGEGSRRAAQRTLHTLIVSLLARDGGRGDLLGPPP